MEQLCASFKQNLFSKLRIYLFLSQITLEEAYDYCCRLGMRLIEFTVAEQAEILFWFSCEYHLKLIKIKSNNFWPSSKGNEQKENYLHCKICFHLILHDEK